MNATQGSSIARKRAVTRVESGLVRSLGTPAFVFFSEHETYFEQGPQGTILLHDMKHASKPSGSRKLGSGFAFPLSETFIMTRALKALQHFVKHAGKPCGSRPHCSTANAAFQCDHGAGGACLRFTQMMTAQLLPRVPARLHSCRS